MRKVIAVLMIIVAFLCSCSNAKEVKASNMAVSVGKQAIQLIDDYLDGRKNAHDVQQELMALHEKMSYTSDYVGTEMTAEQRDDWSISNAILSAEANIGFYEYDSNPENYNTIIERRNNLADLVGIEKR